MQIHFHYHYILVPVVAASSGVDVRMLLQGDHFSVISGNVDALWKCAEVREMARSRGRCVVAGI